MNRSIAWGVNGVRSEANIVILVNGKLLIAAPSAPEQSKRKASSRPVRRMRRGASGCCDRLASFQTLADAAATTTPMGSELGAVAVCRSTCRILLIVNLWLLSPPSITFIPRSSEPPQSHQSRPTGL